MLFQLGAHSGNFEWPISSRRMVLFSDSSSCKKILLCPKTREGGGRFFGRCFIIYQNGCSLRRRRKTITKLCKAHRRGENVQPKLIATIGLTTRSRYVFCQKIASIPLTYSSLFFHLRVGQMCRLGSHAKYSRTFALCFWFAVKLYLSFKIPDVQTLVVYV